MYRDTKSNLERTWHRDWIRYVLHHAVGRFISVAGETSDKGYRSHDVVQTP